VHGDEDTGSPDVDRGIEAPAISTSLEEFEDRIMGPYHQKMAERFDAEMRKLLWLNK
jgi:hypothetical protein